MLPRSGNQKGSVERLVGWVKSPFFKHRKFQDEEDLRAQLEAWHAEVNTRTPSRATGVIPEIRRQEGSHPISLQGVEIPAVLERRWVGNDMEMIQWVRGQFPISERRQDLSPEWVVDVATPVALWWGAVLERLAKPGGYGRCSLDLLFIEDRSPLPPHGPVPENWTGHAVALQPRDRTGRLHVARHREPGLRRVTALARAPTPSDSFCVA